MGLAERDDVVAKLEDVFGYCAAGAGQVVLVSGGMGSGKTELLHDFGSHVLAHDALLLTAAGSRAESALQRGVLDQLLRSGALPTGVQERLSALITVDAAEQGESDESVLRDSDAHAARGVSGALLELARERPVVIAIDDIHLVDNASLQVLLYLQRRMRSARILLVLTELARPSPSHPHFHAEVTRQPHHRVKLGLLSRNGVAELLAQRMDADSAASFSDAYHALSGGNPLLVHAMIDDFDSTVRPGQGDTGELSQPAHSTAFRRTVLSCLHRADPALLTVARGLAMMGEHATTALVARLTGWDVDAVSRAVDELTAAGLVHSGEFRHPATAVTVLDSLAPEQRSRMHITAAELLRETGASPTDIARHIIDAETPLGDWAVPILRSAADEALRERDIELAVRSLDLAMRTTADDRERLEIRQALAKAEWDISPAAAFRHLGELQTALHEGKLAHRDAATIIRCQLWQGDTDAVVRTMNMIVDSGQPEAAGISADFSLAFQWIYGSQPESMSSCSGEDTRTVDPWTQAVRCLTSLWFEGDNAEAIGSAEYILKHRVHDTVLEVPVYALLVLVYAGKLDRAESWCHVLVDEAVRTRAKTWEALLCTVRADIAFRQGDLATAEAQAAHGLELLRPQSWGVLIGYPMYVLLQATTAMGNHERTAELLKRVVPDALFETVPGIRYLEACGYHYLATDRPLAALSQFQACGRWAQSRGMDIPSVIPWRTGLAQAHARLDRGKVAKELVREQLALPDPLVDTRVRGMALRVLAGTDEHGDKIATLTEAVEQLRDSGDQLELSRALDELGRAYHEQGDPARARTVGSRAEQVAKSCHAEPRSGNSLRGGRQEETSQEGMDEAPVLSEAEQRVATLAALGYTNREIGRKLFITVSTVEQHLTRVYRKLNLSSRTDLQAGLSSYRVSTVVGESN